MNRRRNRMCHWVAAVVGLLVPALLAAAEGTPHRLLIIHSFGHNFAPYDAVATAFKENLTSRTVRPVEFYEVSLDTARYGDADVEQPVAEYIRSLYARRRFDLIVPFGSPAVQFVLRNREALMPDTPLLATGVDRRRVQGLNLRTNDTVVPVALDLPGVIAGIRAVLPAVTNIAVVMGASPLERFWADEARREFAPLEGSVSFIWLDGLSAAELKQRLGTLPPHSAVFFEMLAVDALGEPFERLRGLELVCAAANAPVFGEFENQLGTGVVGGRLMSLADHGRIAADVATRILAGEMAPGAAARVVGPEWPIYDARALARWGIPRSRLPAGSEVRFVEPTFWQRYTWPIAAIGCAIVAQTGIIALLLTSRARRRRAEAESSELRREVAHAARVATLGELSASLAHELNQPLTAILSNAQAALRFLAATPPAMGELRDILQDIVADDNRAGQIIRRMRGMATNHRAEVADADLNALIRDAIALLRSDTVARNIDVVFHEAVGLPVIRCDGIQIQQVVHNLLLNACDAMQDSPANARTATVRTEHENGKSVRVSVHDQGTGIPPDRIKRLFEPFYTTKVNGLGMGLPICRSIVEAHGGKLWVESAPGVGATFFFTLSTQGDPHA